MDSIPIDEELCVLGDGAGAVQRGELNTLIRRVAAYHLRPMKQSISSTEQKLDAHVMQCEIDRAKIMGGLTVIKWLTGAIGALLMLVATMIAKYMGWL